MLLADLGATVIKVEPTYGDLARYIGPFTRGESAFFMSVNRGKQSLAVDPKQPEIAAALRALCLSADVVVHNLRQGAMERMGLGYADLAAEEPALVYVVISAFGTTGPDADRPGIDLIFQGESGMMSIAGKEGDLPMKTATTIGDFVAGTNAALAAVAALVGRNEGGRGRLVEIALRDGLIAVQAGWNALFFGSGSQPERTGTASPVTGPNQTFRTADGFINIAVVSDRHFAALCRGLGLEKLVVDQRFTSNELRASNRIELGSAIGQVLIKSTAKHWLDSLAKLGVPVGRVLTLPEVFSDPQVLHNEMVVEVDHARAGRIRIQGSPIRVDGEPARANASPPVLGEHTLGVLMEMGMSKEQVMALQAAGAAVLA
jgi:crotonobetainyl-CoA:carnitine CoA-transferase CaiB-like acyl-CoA transferase